MAYLFKLMESNRKLNTSNKQQIPTIIILILLIQLINLSDSGRPPPSQIKINKCCRNGENLDELKRCVTPGTEKWVPHIFMINKNNYFSPKGEAPRFFTFIENVRPDESGTGTCQYPEYFNGKDKMAIFSNGSLFISEKSIFVPMINYCVDHESALVCLPQSSSSSSLSSSSSSLANNSIKADPFTKVHTVHPAIEQFVKIRKCCGQNMIYMAKNGTCTPVSHEHPILMKELIRSNKIEINYGFPHCSMGQINFVIVGKFDNERFNETTGMLILEGFDGGNTGKYLLSHEYCLEHSVEDFESNVHVFTCEEQLQVPQNYNDIRFTLYATALLISIVFLLATLAAGFLLPSNHHVLHWRCQTYYIICLIIGDALLAPSQFLGNAVDVGQLCVVIASFTHFFFLAAFFWLNTMCFNIWWTFRDFRPTSLEKGQETVRLRIYSVYAWGLPLVIAGVAAILDNVPVTGEDTFLRPRFGEKRCWFYGDMEMFTYFFGPIGILLFVNFLLFALTARQLTCGLWKRDDVKSTTERAALGRVCLKLVVVMGVTWVADLLSWFIGGPHYIWYVTDMINALHGVFIFIVVGCQPQVWAAVKRLWTTKTGRGLTNTTNGQQHSSSSHGLPSIGESVTNNTFTNNTTSTKPPPMETIC